MSTPAIRSWLAESFMPQNVLGRIQEKITKPYFLILDLMVFRILQLSKLRLNMRHQE